MGWSDEAEQGFPPQRHREPAALRQEILDELTDHFALAAERESESGVEDDQQIRTRVLKKFGNPAAIARTLWWDAMKETLMKDWIQISINAVICIAVIGFMALFYRQMQTTNTALINALNDRPSAADELYPSVEFILHRGSLDGPLVQGLRLQLEGRVFTEELTSIYEESDSEGRAIFGPIRAGKYYVGITDKITKLRVRKAITLYSGGETKTFHVAIPPTTQISLDTTAPLGQHVTSKDFRVFMNMSTVWSHEGERWSKGSREGVFVTADGIFRTRNHPSFGLLIQPGERITHAYGNRVSFSSPRIVQSYYPQEDGDEWFMPLSQKDDPYYSNYSNASTSHDLQPDGPNTIVLDLPDILLDRYDYYVRLSANSKHGLLKRFSWFPKYVSEEFTNFVIDEARLVEHSFYFRWHNREYDTQGGGVGESIHGESGQLYVLKNAPRNLPDGYKLFLASKISSVHLRDLGLVDVNLCAYLDSSPISYIFDQPRYNDPPQLSTEPLWKLDANEIAATGSEVLFVDLTDAVNDDPTFESASGVLLKWEAKSKNTLMLMWPETASANKQPVWLIMKPIANDSPSNANDD